MFCQAKSSHVNNIISNLVLQKMPHISRWFYHTRCIHNNLWNDKNKFAFTLHMIFWPAFIRHHSVRLRRTSGVRPRPSAFHCLYVTSRGPDQFSWCFLPYIRWRHTAYGHAQHIWPSTCTRPPQSMFDCCSCMVPEEWSAAERWQVRGHNSGHSCPATLCISCFLSRRRWKHPAGLITSEVSWRDPRQPHALWQSRQSRRQGMQLSYPRPAART